MVNVVRQILQFFFRDSIETPLLTPIFKYKLQLIKNVQFKKLIIEGGTLQ